MLVNIVYAALYVLPPIRSCRLCDVETEELRSFGACLAVDGVGDYLDCELLDVEHHFFQRVFFAVHLPLNLLSRSNEHLQNFWYEPGLDLWLHKIVGLGIGNRLPLSV